MAISASTWVVVSQIFRVVNVSKNGLVSSIAKESSPMTMQAALSSVNFGLNAKPSASKNRIVRARLSIGRLTRIFRDLMSLPGLRRARGGTDEHAALDSHRLSCGRMVVVAIVRCQSSVQTELHDDWAGAEVETEDNPPLTGAQVAWFFGLIGWTNCCERIPPSATRRTLRFEYTYRRANDHPPCIWSRSPVGAWAHA